jgi:formylglycine-generating enzyme required for sulfatase activity
MKHSILIIASLAAIACESKNVSVDNLKAFETEEGYVIPVKGETITLRKYDGDFFVMGPTLDLGVTRNPELQGVILDGYAIGTEVITGLSWDDAQKYVKKIRKQTGIPFRLPSEAEWEYAARQDASMCGRYAELCQDTWDDGVQKVMKGGKKSNPATRQGLAPYTKSSALGFRLAVSTGEEAPAYWRDLINESKVEREQSDLKAETFKVNGVSFKMLPVEGGTFRMGATAIVNSNAAFDDEFPVHDVTLDNFKIGRTEVTCDLWQAVMGSLPPYLQGGDYPVCNVSWYDAQLFIVKLNQLTGRKFRLPTEAEWEYAAKGGNKGHDCCFSGSNSSSYVSWSDQKDGKTHPVAKLIANELDIYDMSGNAWEWVLDRSGKYTGEAQVNPVGPSEARDCLDLRVMRGGSANAKWKACRVSNRGENYAAKFKSTIGFRLAL